MVYSATSPLKKVSDCLWEEDSMALAINPKQNKNSHGVVNCGDISNSICRRLIDEHKNQNNKLVTGRVQQGDKYIENKNIRDVTAWIIHEDNEWVDEIIINTTYTALQYLDYDVVGLLERPQLLRYTAPSKGYQWHIDLGQNESSNRKISISINLNDNYDGGALAFFSDKLYKLKMPRGQSVAFPAFLSHKVMPITKGERWSLVAWISGGVFR